MKTRALLVLVLTAALGVLSLPVLAQEEQTVNATVSVQMISIEVDNTSLDYGQVAAGSHSQPTPAFFTITNTGNVGSRLEIRGESSANWTLSTEPGEDIYAHLFTTQDLSVFDPGQLTPLDASNKVVSSLVGPDDSVQVYLWLAAPTSTAHSAVQTLPVHVRAVVP